MGLKLRDFPIDTPFTPDRELQSAIRARTAIQSTVPPHIVLTTGMPPLTYLYTTKYAAPSTPLEQRIRVLAVITLK